MVQPRPRIPTPGHRRFSPPAPNWGNAAVGIIPYDYAASFELTGRPGNIVQDVVNISVEGVFVAVAIGYGFEEERGRPMTVTPPVVNNSFKPGDVKLGEIPAEALIGGFRVHPRFESAVFKTDAAPAQNSKEFLDQPLPADFTGRIFQRVKSPEDISFLFSIVDTGTGRELQDEPTHNLASLGKSNGERPFRLLAQPLSFLPRSTIRLQIVERSEGAQGTLFIVLYGYKIVGTANCPEPVARSLHAAASRASDRPSARIIPFDYVARLELTGQPGNIVEDEVSINVEGGYVATAIGYGLAVENQDVSPRLQPIDVITDPTGRVVINLNLLQLNRFPPDAVSEGFRIRPNFVRLAFTDDARLTTQLPADLVNRVFERINRPEEVSFRYSISDSGTGRELQNKPIHNIAGLGIANGNRPFKKLARPMTFLPRSTIRVMVQEHFGRGTLFMVFQGYKILSSASPRGRS